jgi:branched-chain amino acid transport system ATP-binding protein
VPGRRVREFGQVEGVYMTALQVVDLTAGYQGVPVIESLSLDVARGEVVAIIGRNGAGKSTTLMSISGLLSSYTGSVSVEGKTLHGDANRRCSKALALVLEGRSVFESLTVAQNLKVARVPAAAAYEIFPELERVKDRRAGVLSGGEQQMLAVSRAIARKPDVLLVDELSFGLAPITCRRLFKAVRDYAVLNHGVLLVEQHIHYATEVADRILVMHQGAIRLELPSGDLLGREAEIEKLYLGGP